MTALARPDVRLHESWAATILEFGPEQMHGSGHWHVSDELRGSVTREACQEWVRVLLELGDTSLPIREEWVHCDYLWITDDAGGSEEVVGFLALRHRLNAFLLDEGGHIGYSVRPSRRREGHASRALALAVARAAELGIDSVLVTCDDDNVGSRRTIENGGGVYEDTRKRKERYWIPTASSRDGAPAAPR